MLKKFLSKKQIQVFSYIIGLCFILFFNREITKKIKIWKNISQDISSLYSKTHSYFLKKNYNQEFNNSEDLSIIFNSLNSKKFLSTEKLKLQELLSNPYFIENKSLKKRLSFILSPNSNKMLFFSKQHLSGDISFILENTIEVDLEDLLVILSIIENNDTKIPYFISELEIKRAQTVSQQEVWKLKCNLLKRCL